MKLIGNLDVDGEVSGAFKEYATFPKDPKVGTWARINRMIMVCSELDDGTPIWLPMTPERDTFIHTQSAPSLAWIVPHNLGIKEVIIQCYDESGKVSVPSNITPVDASSCLVQFPIEVSGKAIAMVGYTDGQAIASGANVSAYSGRGAPLFDEIKVGSAHLCGYIVLGKDGMLYMSGRSPNYSHGQGDGSTEYSGGFNLIQLPYHRANVLDFNMEEDHTWALLDNGELWGWGSNAGYMLGTGDTTVRKIPTLIAEGVAEVTQMEDSSYTYADGDRRRIYKMKDGSYKVVGRCNLLVEGSDNHAKTPTNLLMPEGVNYSDVELIRISGNLSRGCVYMQTKDKRHFIQGNNAYGQLGIGEPRHNVVKPWNHLTQFDGLTLQHITGTDGWYTDGGDRACRYLHFTNGDVYYAGEHYSGQYATGRELEDLPMDATLACTWTLIQSGVEEIQVTHAPCAVSMKQRGVWKTFGYSQEYQIQNTPSRNVMTPLPVPCSGNAKLVTKLNAYSIAYNQPLIYLDGNTFHLRATCNYGIAMDGNTSRVLKEWEKREWTLDKSEIKSVVLGQGYSAYHTLLVLLENGSLYGIGYGGWDILSGTHGHVRRDAVCTWRRLN